MTLTNGQLAELFARAAAREADHRARALRRASRAALFWHEDAAALAAVGRPLTELRAVGPWVARQLLAWLEDPPEVPEPPPLRRGYRTTAEARAILAHRPEYLSGVEGDLQVHTTWSDGGSSVAEMAAAAAALGYRHVLFTDHSKGLPIASGMDEERLAGQGHEIAAVNRSLEASGGGFRVLHGIEMNLSPQGEGDMDPAALARLDVVLGAFHSQLRLTEDQTERYLAAVRNPDVHVLAHPRCRMYDRRAGLTADWPRVLAEAAALDKAVEVDANAYRQDLDPPVLEVAREAGVRISIGTDAHSIAELGYMELGLAAVAAAGIPRERVLNYLSAEELLNWAEGVRPTGPVLP